MDLWDLTKLLSDFKRAIDNRDKWTAKGNVTGANIAQFSANQAEQDLKRGYESLREDLKTALGSLPFGGIEGYIYNNVGEWMDSVQLPVEESTPDPTVNEAQ